MSFRQILQATREPTAVTAWQRARIASNLRHLAASRGDRRSARRLSWMKQEAIRLVASLLPGELKITVDSDNHVGLVSVRLTGHGRLHLPANSSIGYMAPPIDAGKTQESNDRLPGRCGRAGVRRT